MTRKCLIRNIKWARDNQQCDRNTTLWTGEGTIELGKHLGHLCVTHHPGKEYLPEG
jgi:hypothetical protein